MNPLAHSWKKTEVITIIVISIIALTVLFWFGRGLIRPSGTPESKIEAMIEGTVLEVDEGNSLVRVRDLTQPIEYIVFISSDTVITIYDKRAWLPDLVLHERVSVTGEAVHDGAKFYATSIKIGPVTAITRTVGGGVTEINTKDSFIRIFDAQKSVVYTVYISRDTTITREGKMALFANLSVGDGITATAKGDQDAFEFHADSIIASALRQSSFPTLPPVGSFH